MTRPGREALPPAVLAALAGLVTGLGVATAAAQDSGEPIVLEYRASSGCPDEAAFVARVRARTSRARLAWPGEVARRFVVNAEAGPPAGGDITVTNEHATEGTRTLRADTCEEVADGLALILALAVDPHARATPTVEAAPSAPPGASQPGATPPTPSSSVDPLPPAPLVVLAAPSSPPAPPPPASPEREVPHSAPLPLGQRFVVGADFAIAVAVAPQTLFAASPFLGVRALRSKLFDLDVRASFFRVDSGSIRFLKGTADFTFTVGRIDGCVLFRLGHGVGVGPCARVETGALDVVGMVAGAVSVAQDTPWLAAGGTGRIEWVLVGSFMLDVDAGVTARMIQDSFYFASDRKNLYTVPVAGFEGALGMGARFP
jgi:hypothetical protein